MSDTGKQVMFTRKWFLSQTLGITLFASAVSTPAMSDEAAIDYDCNKHWSGPAILLPGGLLPLPYGYALVDRTSQPHIFRNVLAAVQEGGELGNIHVGFTPNQEEWFTDETEFRAHRFTWHGVHREQLRHLSTGQELEVFSFTDGVMMEFSGAALPFSELVASCYLQILSPSFDRERLDEM